jgi:hypothetical protein
MFFRWSDRPALMFPGRAYVIQSPGEGWTEVDYRDIASEAETLAQDEFWTEFESWKLPGFPPEFALLERRPEFFNPVRTRGRRLAFF